MSFLSPKERQLNEIEVNFDFGFDLDFNFYNNPILRQRLNIGSQVFHSKDYARDFLIIIKILDRLNFSLIKQEFINSEFIS